MSHATHTSIGIDGCKSGWFYIAISDDQVRHGVVQQVDQLLPKDRSTTRLFIDIPIGLRDDSPEPRGCDRFARKRLGKRRSSVFPAPLRTVLDAENHATATARSVALCGKGLSCQAFAIAPKIREIDTLMRSNPTARNTIREVHPELCFYGLNGGRPMQHRKKTLAGFDERLAVLELSAPGLGVVEITEEILATYRRSQVARDDVLDAWASAATGLYPDHWHTAPDDPERDAFGLPMEMLYALRDVGNQI
jgi:predicted RNase H-like nuclease